MHAKQAITDSIHYASRIQSAILPPPEYIANYLSEHFILWKPRDIVSGDFYWMTEHNNKVIITAADCTGHGVPGAFMSMLGVSFLNEIVNKNEVTQANEILNQLRENVIRSLHQTGKENEAKDGMDISMCVFDFQSMTLQFAGAYNPLIMIRDGEATQIKADKMPIGIYFKGQKSFTNNEIKIQKDDCFYISSDGYVDQFGGDDGRKFMSKKFKELLVEIHHNPMSVQREILNHEIETWRGKLEQIDDILVIGVRI